MIIKACSISWYVKRSAFCKVDQTVGRFGNMNILDL